ncbi:MAG: hypothetical protein IMX04_05000 [Candidatus Carbobacillus altaicus]|nr:hypothetical protein [Candidatus Carbobacillus altaicus]
MNLINFSNNFIGFQEGEDILVDTGILLAYFNEYDAYYSAVKELFDHYIYGTNTSIFLYVNPTIVNEITHLAHDPVKRYLAAHPADQTKFDMTTLNTLQDKITNGVKGLIEDEILYVLDGNEESVIKQIELSKALGSADAVNASIADLFGTSFLTVDKKLAYKMKSVEIELPNIRNVYYTTSQFRDY